MTGMTGGSDAPAAGEIPVPRPDALAVLAGLDDPAAGPVDEVILAVVDLPGRLLGTGLSPEFFRREVLAHGYGACAYLYAVDVEMETSAGYAYNPAEEGFGDLRLVPDLSTLRRAPWHPASAVVLADAVWPDGTPVDVAPRAVLRAQLDRLRAAGLRALAGTELEFLVFREGYRRAAARGYGGLTPASRYNVDYALAGTEDMDDLVRQIRRAMAASGSAVESARAEVHPGQYEIVFRYDDALRTCDQHVLYKTTAKKLAAAAGRSITFMARYDQGEGNSCHIHLSLRAADGTPVFPADSPGGSEPAMSELMRSFVAGQLACMAEFALLFAPNVNSYKRLAPGTFAPTAIAWGRDNRTCAVRVVGRGPSLRIEHRVPGGDANPYLAVAGIVAAGLYGIRHRLPLEPARTGNVFTAADPVRLPRTLAEALRLWRNSERARAAFGDRVVDHLAHAAEVELDSFDRAVTDWERIRGFERF